MLEEIIIIGIVMAVMELVKKTPFPKEAYFLPILILAGGLNAGNAYLFAGATDVMPYVAEGLKLGAVASGVYGLGKAAMGKS